jgi:hypothetical protein
MHVPVTSRLTASLGVAGIWKWGSGKTRIGGEFEWFCMSYAVEKPSSAVTGCRLLGHASQNGRRFGSRCGGLPCQGCFLQDEAAAREADSNSPTRPPLRNMRPGRLLKLPDAVLQDTFWCESHRLHELHMHPEANDSARNHLRRFLHRERCAPLVSAGAAFWCWPAARGK